MRKERSTIWAVIALLVVASMLLSACGPKATEAPATEAPPVATEAPTEAATSAPTEAPTTAATEAPTTAATEAAVSGNVDYSPDIPEPTEPVTVTWSTWVNTDSPFWKQTIADFESVHPNITIDVQSVP